VLNQLNALSKQKHVSPYDMATIHVGLQENDQAFTWLERAFEQRSHWLGYLKLEPQLDPLRSDPVSKNCFAASVCPTKLRAPETDPRFTMDLSH